MLVTLAGCGEPTRTISPDLATYLATVAGADADFRRREVESWKLDEPAWQRTVVDPYRALHADYARAYDVDRIAERLRGPARISVRKHYAGDPGLTRGEATTRWALPVLAAAQVASIARPGEPGRAAELDVVFVRDGERWRAITGLDEIVHARVAAIAADCAALLAVQSPSSRCREIQWQIADAALRTDGTRFTHACGLAANLCGKPSP